MIHYVLCALGFEWVSVSSLNSHPAVCFVRNALPGLLVLLQMCPGCVYCTHRPHVRQVPDTTLNNTVLMIQIGAARKPTNGQPRTKTHFMVQQLKTLLNRTYEVQSPETCTVTNSAGTTILTAHAGTPVQFVADGKEVTLSSDAATLLPVNRKKLVSFGGGATSTGESVVMLSSPAIVVRHAIWFDNASQTAITIQPAEWENKVMTCYLKTAVPVTLSGVTWLDDAAPTMESGYTHLIAIQQIAPATIVANLAYSLPQ